MIKITVDVFVISITGALFKTSLLAKVNKFDWFVVMSANDVCLILVVYLTYYLT